MPGILPGGTEGSGIPYMGYRWTTCILGLHIYYIYILGSYWRMHCLHCNLLTLSAIYWDAYIHTHIPGTTYYILIVLFSILSGSLHNKDRTGGRYIIYGGSSLYSLDGFSLIVHIYRTCHGFWDILSIYICSLPLSLLRFLPATCYHFHHSWTLLWVHYTCLLFLGSP